MRTITLEEHFASPAFLQGPGQGVKELAERRGLPDLVDQLSDIGAGRVALMDAAGVDVQVMSLTAPGVEQLDAGDAVAIARDANDVLGEAVRRYPDRLAGFAALPTPAPEEAAAELERTVREHGFKGAMINGHARGRYLDDQSFRPILERAEALGVPLYIHPTPPPQPVVDASYGGFAPAITNTLAAAGWGWHIETATHVLRLVVGGAFDRYPNLQVVVGHMGEGLVLMIPRFDQTLTPEITGLNRPVSAYLRENVHYTFSGFNWTPAFLELLLQVGVDRIMFSADHPYQPMRAARAFLDQLPVSDADRERIAHGNAERLLRL
jgi:uncharacterized protein